MELTALGNLANRGVRLGVFGTFTFVLMVLTFDTWLQLEALGAWMNRIGVEPLTRIAEVLIHLGQHPEILFGIALLLGVFTIILLFPHQIGNLSSNSQSSRTSHTDNEVDKSGGGFITLLILCFIIIRAGMLFVYDGTYPDEYWSVLSGQEMIQDSIAGERILSNGDTRSEGIISVLVGVSVAIFGEHVWAIKLVPFLISLGSVILLAVIGKHVLRSSTTIAFLILLYTFSPWLIFQHFYARSYVLYEFIVLLLLVVAFRVINALRTLRIWSVVGWGSVLCILPVGTSLLSEDEGGVILLLLAGILISYIFLFELQNIFDTRKSQDRSTTSETSNSFPRIILLYKLIFLLVLGTVMLLVFNVHQILRDWMTLDIIGSSVQGQAYLEFFLDTHVIFTLFFLLSLLTLILPDREQVFSTITIVAAFLLFILHVTINPEYQSLRAVIYMLPLFFVGTLFAVERFSVHPIIGLLAPILLLNNLLGSYPENFFDGPYIPKEVSYIDYKKAFTFAKQQCKNHNVLYGGPSPYSGSFYGMKPDYVVQRTQSLQNLQVANTSDVIQNTARSSIPVVNTPSQLTRLTRGSYCYIEYQPGRSSFISEENRAILLSNVPEKNTKEFQNITIYVYNASNQ